MTWDWPGSRWCDVRDWIPAGVGPCVLLNERTGRVIASRVDLAITRGTRRTGLLGRQGLDATEALVLAPCIAIHTAFMRFPIDVVFVDRRGRALRVVGSLKPWRAAMAPLASAVIELRAEAAGGAVEPGDALCLLRAPAPREPDGAR